MHALERYLYDPETPYTSTDAKKLFDHLDFVFIDGDAGLLPWLPHAERLVTFIRMCKRTNKLLFAASCAMQVFMYIYSFTQRIRRVVNGAGKGGSLSDAQKLSKDILARLRPGEVLLDSSTGDVYQYDSNLHEFYPVGNVGLHHRKAAEDNLVVRSAMLSSISTPAKAVTEQYPLFAAKLTEAICRVNRPYVHHWLLRDLSSSEFLVPQLNTWDVHPVNLTTKDSNMQVLAVSARGPLIITYANCVAVQFHISDRYPATVSILRSFIQYNMKRFEQDSDRVDLRLDQVLYEYGPKTNSIGLERSRHRVTLPPSDPDSLLLPRRPDSSHSTHTRPRTAGSYSFISGPMHTPNLSQKVTTEVTSLRPKSAVKNSGFAFSKRFHEKLIVENNATTLVPIPLYATQNPNIRCNRTNSPNFKQQPGLVADLTIRGDFDKTRSVELLKKVVGIRNTVETGPIKPSENHSLYDNSELMDSEKMGVSTFEFESMSLTGVKSDPQHWKTQSEIREMLHPGYPLGRMPKQGPRTFKSRSMSTIAVKKPVKLVVARIPSSTGKIRPTTPIPHGGIANDGSLYEDPDVKRRKLEQEERKKWVASHDFITFGKVRREPHFEPDLSGKSPLQHEYRSVNRGKWLSGKFVV